MHTTHRSFLRAGAGLNLALLAGAGWTFHALAQPKPAVKQEKPANVKPTPADKKTKPSKDANIDLDDPDMDEATGVLTGRNFVYKEDDTVITGLTAHYNDKQKRLLAEGNLVMDDPKHHITGEKADVDNNKDKKLAIITGSVVIVLKPKEDPNKADPNAIKPMVPAGGVAPAPVTPPLGQPTAAPSPEQAKADKDKKEDLSAARARGLTIFCDRVESQYKKKFTIMRGNLSFKQKVKKDGREIERTVTAEHAEYDGKKDRLELFLPVKFVDSDGQQATFEKNVVVGTKEEASTVQSKGRASFRILLPEEDEEDKGEKRPMPPP